MRRRWPAFRSAAAPGPSRSATTCYSAAAQGGTTGLLKTISNGSGTGAAQGRVVNGALVPQTYPGLDHHLEEVRGHPHHAANGNIKDFGIEPAPPVDPDRIPVTDAHKKGVLDPMTATLLRVPGTGELLTPDACRAGPPCSTAACATSSSSTSSAWKR